MVRTKSGRRKPELLKRIGLDDSLPIDAIEFLCNLPPSEELDGSGPSSSDERPAKRHKGNYAGDHHSIHVADGRISIARRCSEEAPLDFTVTHDDASRHLKFNLVDLHLNISSRKVMPLGSLNMILTVRDIDPTTAVIIKAAGSGLRSESPGAMWMKTSLTIQRQGRMASIHLRFQLFWNETPLAIYPLRSTRERGASRCVMNTIFASNDAHKATLSPMDFYNAAFVPPKDQKVLLPADIPGLASTLYPYQKRTLNWLLRREGVRWSEDQGSIEALPDNELDVPINAFREVSDVHGEKVYLSDVFHTITRDYTEAQRAQTIVKGGILSEEMGLGKTIEMLGLILLNQRPDARTATAAEAAANLTPSGATLIVTPISLKDQWISEISRHAPGLRVKYYQGIQGQGLVAGDDDRIVAELADYDVVITTYSVLSLEIHHATTPPERSRRYERVYTPAKSPLVQIAWWRVCLDEAQMIENGYNQAAIVACLIPRVNAWGVTGTPIKDDVKDLFGLLLFLRFEPFGSSPHVWQSLIREHKPLFQQLFKGISLRHTKALVRDEISLPAQKRFVISMPFTAVEEQHYQSLYREMAEACELSLDGSPLVHGWDPENHEEDMRVWLNRLRQTALHPQVAAYNRRVLGQNNTRPMRTVDEVLDAMLGQTENTIKTEERALLSVRLTRGQLFENSPRVGEALAIWQDVRNEADRLVLEARDELRNAMQEVGKQPEAKLEDLDLDYATDDGAEEKSGKDCLGESRRRLRSALEMQHKAVFFCANAHFQLRDNPDFTEPDSEEYERLKKLEDEEYEQAKLIRREILRESHFKATKIMRKIAKKASEQSFAVIPELKTKPNKGIESSRIVENLEDLYDDLNLQANTMDDLREHIIQLLLRPLLDEEDDVETTGEELMDSAKFQDQLMVHIQALRATIADRQVAITGQKNELVKHETETSIRLAREGGGPAPEKLIELMLKRAEISPDSWQTSMRGAVADLRSLMLKLTRESGESTRHVLESEIASMQLKDTQHLVQEQTKAIRALESEIDVFTAAMNLRLAYYRQLQAVSDSVLPYEGPCSEVTIDRFLQTEHDLRRKVSSAESKHRYLLHLKEAGAKSNEPRMCVICQTTFTTGVLTVCGHQFCKECMMIWFKAHHNCPVCKRGLKSSNLHDITIKPQQLQVHSESNGDNPGGSSQSPQQKRSTASMKTMIYSEFNSEKLAEIKNIELDGPSFTTKIDTLVRHLIWLRDADPGAKSIVFTQYQSFIDILQNAFRHFQIGFSSIDRRDGIEKFKNDASVECFLLHARAHSSGLNLVNASHVFLCEPLLNTALELQAIARVDRIGQQYETTVWLYLVSGTVEESIYNLSVQRRMEHMGRIAKSKDSKDKGKSKETSPELMDAKIEAANTLELEHAALSKLMSKDHLAGERVDKSDLWQCLFGNAAAQGSEPERDNRIQEQAVMGYLAAEAAEKRVVASGSQ